ncbi:MAG: hypothetical protein Q7R44_00870 [bacterium]|nr:hypothetical protein [bacterium]
MAENNEQPIPSQDSVIKPHTPKEIETAERHARFADMVWANVQEEAAGKPTGLTKPGVADISSRAVAQAAKEGLLSDRQTMETLYRDLEKWTSVGNAQWKQEQVSRLLNELRNAQAKPSVVPAPPQVPQPIIEVKSRSLNPLKMFRKKA